MVVKPVALMPDTVIPPVIEYPSEISTGSVLISTSAIALLGVPKLSPPAHFGGHAVKNVMKSAFVVSEVEIPSTRGTTQSLLESLYSTFLYIVLSV